MNEFHQYFGELQDQYPFLIAALTGFISGLLLSIPVGPVNLTIINEGARRGFFWAAMIGLGATIMEVIYCALAFTGFASFFKGKVINAVMELTSFVFMLYLGIKFLMAKTVAAPTHLTKTTDKIEERIEEKLHPHAAFWIGFVRVMGNPGVFLFWIVLAASFISRGWVDDVLPAKLSCIGGVAAGTGLWFFGLSYAVSLGHKKFTEKTLLRMEHYSGIGLLGLAVAHGVHIVWQMAHHKM
jgi:threonine/homoserine/homoserine lactone efflux protein